MSPTAALRVFGRAPAALQRSSTGPAGVPIAIKCRSLVCAQCDQGFLHLKDLKDHLKAHASAAGYPCPDCGQRFSRMNNLKRHRAIKHGRDVTWHFCQHCPYRTSFGPNLTRHMADRHDIGVIWRQCAWCSRSFKQAGDRAFHERRCREGHGQYVQRCRRRGHNAVDWDIAPKRERFFGEDIVPKREHFSGDDSDSPRSVCAAAAPVPCSKALKLKRARVESSVAFDYEAQFERNDPRRRLVLGARQASALAPRKIVISLRRRTTPGPTGPHPLMGEELQGLDVERQLRGSHERTLMKVELRESEDDMEFGEEEDSESELGQMLSSPSRSRSSSPALGRLATRRLAVPAAGLPFGSFGGPPGGSPCDLLCESPGDRWGCFSPSPASPQLPH